MYSTLKYTESFHYLKTSAVSALTLFSLHSWQPLTFSFFSIVLPFLECQATGILKYTDGGSGFFHLVIHIEGSPIHLHGLIAHFCFSLNNIPYMNEPQFLQPYCVQRHNGCFQFLPIMNKAVFTHWFLCGQKFSNQLANQKNNCWIIWYNNFQLCRKLPDCLTKRLYYLVFQPAMIESFHFSPSSPAFGIVKFVPFQQVCNGISLLF